MEEKMNIDALLEELYAYSMFSIRLYYLNQVLY